MSIGLTRNAGSDSAVYMLLILDVFLPGLNPTFAAVKDAAVAARKGEGNLCCDVEQEGVGLGNHMEPHGLLRRVAEPPRFRFL